ncbi:MAG: sigma-70 family RNA polymerase sigma factor [Acidobacteria bacterium]|nr:MAG: sigma-70 family RNA polymerase sigma factor [Acidobacteriota bacterium]
MPRQPTDSELVARTRAGEERAFAMLVDRHKDALVGYLTRMSGSHAMAEDLAQETFLAFYRHLPRYREDGRLRAFLFTIATNLLRSAERRERRRRLLGASPEPAPEEGGPSGGINGRRAGPEDAVYRTELRKRLSAALAGLPMRYRVPVVLHDVMGWSHAEIAGLLGTREGTVKSRIFRGRERLRAELASLAGGRER